jgi:hypothetical protein
VLDEGMAEHDFGFGDGANVSGTGRGEIVFEFRMVSAALSARKHRSAKHQAQRNFKPNEA